MIILDTSVVSELMRPRPEFGVVDWTTRQAGSNLYLSTISEAELRYGFEMLPIGQRRKDLLTRVEEVLLRFFEGRILPFDRSAARSYARIAAARRSAGRPMNPVDCQIAAIAGSLGAAIATRDTTDFEECGIEVINPWSDADSPGQRHPR